MERYTKEDWLNYAKKLTKSVGEVHRPMSEEDINFYTKGIKF